MHHIDPLQLILVDIETVPAYPRFESLPDEWKNLWIARIRHQLPEGQGPADLYPVRAGVMAEFSRIICISIGYFIRDRNLFLKLMSFSQADESALLQAFISRMDLIQQHQKGWAFAGHNIREFDIPFICRRLLANRMSIPGYLNFQHMKPWETHIVDSFQYWRFGDYKHFTSLDLLAAVLQVPSSKGDMDGSMVGPVYWEEGTDLHRAGNLERIVRYCEKDVVTTGNVILRLAGMPILHPDDILD
ncbi:MAG: ribonuclease H-like domain-containing protein [Ferruginibacter sp.]